MCSLPTLIVPVSGKPSVEPTVKVPPAAGALPVTAAAANVFLNWSVKPLKISSENEANFTVASSSAAAAPALFVFLVRPVKVVEVFPVYVISSVPINKVPEVGKPVVVSTVSVVTELFIAPLRRVFA